MTYSATVYQVFIASPSDVGRERLVITDVIHNWNTTHSVVLNTVLLPVKWETHATPRMGDRPQAIINKQIVQESDILVAIFKARLGTPTGEAESGTVEEINEFRAKGKPVLVYFSNAPIVPSSIASRQFSKLKKFKKECQKEGLIFYYNSVRELRDLLRHHLLGTVRELKGMNDVPSMTEQHFPSETSNLELNFFDPHKNLTFTADVSVKCTGDLAIKGLQAGDMNGPFIDPSPNKTFQLVITRTNQVIAPSETFGQIGAINGDTIEVRQLD